MINLKGEELILPKKTINKENAVGQVVSEEYHEEIEENFEGTGEETEAEASVEADDSTMIGEFETGTEEVADTEDYAEVSSEDPVAVETDLESPDYGDEGAPPDVENDLELEPVDGFDETMLELGREEAQGDEENLLDAWYAEFAEPTTIALARQQPNLTQQTAEVVIGKDDRIQITNTKAYPWRTICSLIITARDGSRWIGTGWLVGPRTVITAGHVVYMHKRGGWARSIDVIPGRNGSDRPYGTCPSSNFHSVKGWTKNKKRSHDYGAIILPKSCPYGNQLGYFGYANLGYFSLLGLKVNLSGYPGDKPSGTQWWHARRIKWVTPRTLVYNIDTAGGQSGSPVWRLKGGKRHVVGIHTNGSVLGNSRSGITKYRSISVN
ncbi:MAG: hypothetical protein D3910_15700, partial [Candidatus Electrothrix sp. ATG2]|nr:hypothetical protein [Candidatus Electrothrix sp. ATG2]